jgi:two-component system response regulator DevR
MKPAAVPRIRVAIVEDSEVVRMGLRALLAGEPGLELVGESGTVAGAAAVCAKGRADVVLLDIRLPDGNGFDACRQILKAAPATRFLVLTSVADDALIAEAIRAGVHGYLLKEIDGKGLVQAIREVAAGKSIIDPAVTARVIDLVRSGGKGGNERAALAALSPQEKRVLALIAEGRTNKEVGLDLNLSEKTVKNYLSNVFDKLNVSRRAQAAALYAQEKPRAP